ncbi:hypothetical protein ACIBF1_28450 [Spirillospora sp. NPDC050679]
MPIARSRKLVLTAAGSALLVAAAAVAVAAEGDEEDRPPVRLVAPVGRPDPVPTGRLVKDRQPANCGVSEATVRALVPRPGRNPRHCSWPVDRSTGPSLHVSLNVSDGIAKAMREYGGPTIRDPEWVAQMRPDGTVTVTGLGDEASFYQRPGRVHLFFRAANVVARVDYEAPGENAEQVRDGGLRAASDMARALGAPARPVQGAPSGTGKPVKQVPQVCDALPGELAALLVPDGKPRRDDRRGPLWRRADMPVTTCVWEGAERGLLVSLLSFPDGPPGPGAWQAERDYLEMHETARAENDGFTALAGLGEQAYGAADRTTAKMMVVFRVRNVVGAVEYGELRRHTLEPDAEALKGAYTAGLKAAEKLAIASGE